MAECAVLYARVSTAMQGEGYSLSTQLESGRRYAAIHGYHIVGEYCDQGSGELLHRPQLDELLARAHSDPFQVVVVHDLDRFTRNPSHLAILEMELEQTGARVEFVLGDYTATPEGQLGKAVKAAIAQYENRQRAERSQRGRRGRVEAGRVRSIGQRAPYGYRYVPAAGAFVVQEDEAAIVRWMYEQAAAGAGGHTLAANLTAAGSPLPSGKLSAWNSSTVYRILHNPLYCGVWSEHIDGVRYSAAVPPLVDPTLWAAVQERMGAPSPPPRTFLLTGFLRCTCGKPWVGRTLNAASAYYRCSSIGQRLMREACPMPGSIRAERLEAAVWEAVTNLLQQPNWLEKGLAKRRKAIAAIAAERTVHLQQATDALARLDAREGALLDALLEERLSAPAVAAARTTLAAERTALADRLASLQAEPLPTLPHVDRTQLDALVAQEPTSLDREQRRRLLHLLDVRLVVERQDRVHFSALGGLTSATLSLIPLVRPLPAKERPAYRPRKELLP